MTGRTKKAAEAIQKLLSADLFSIKPQTPYPRDFNTLTQIGREEIETQAYPDIVQPEFNLAEYEIVLIGYPTWWLQPPRLIFSLPDVLQFQGKTIVPFTTSEKTPIAVSQPFIAQLAAQTGAHMLPGYRYTGNDDTLSQFLQKLP